MMLCKVSSSVAVVGDPVRKLSFERELSMDVKGLDIPPPLTPASSASSDSPKSVITIALSSFKSRISVSDNGAEVTLAEEGKESIDLYRNIDSIFTPAKSEASSAISETALAVVTPNTPDTPMKNFPLCGLYACWQQEAREAGLCTTEDSTRMQGCILAMLSSDEEDHGWQRMLSSMADELDEEDDATLNRDRILRNRAFYAQSRKERLRDLRRDLNPFASPVEEKSPLASRCNSFSTPPTRSKSYKERCTMAAPLKSPWNWSCSQVHTSPSTNVVEPEGHVCYDSDPEEYQQRRRRSRTFGSTVSSQTQHWRKLHVDAMSNEEAMQDLIQALFRDRWTFIMHPPEGNPMAVEAWLERGQRLLHHTLAPKLVWRARHPKVAAKRKQFGGDLSAVELLDIQRIVEVKKVDRQHYPFAKARRTFVIKSLRGTFWLEARTQYERDSFVRHLKLAVARFGSQLVIGDPAVEEFFVPLGEGPGGAMY